MSRVHTRTFVVMSTMLSLFALARPALAGPPFLCHPFDIGSAASLPWDGSSDPAHWLNGRADYDVSRLVDDTMTLLTPTAPVIVRMETLRRATIYATQDRVAAINLLKAVMARATKLQDQGRPNALAWFDAAYLAESFREATMVPDVNGVSTKSLVGLTDGLDASALMQKSLALRPDDGAIHFAVALIAGKPSQHEHARIARANDARDELLARNLHYLGFIS